ncbi:hypothetical protein KJ815_13590, partial [bacterium]|nr:hypothetical protein [bacterium]
MKKVIGFVCFALLLPGLVGAAGKGATPTRSVVPEHEGRYSLGQGGETCLEAFDLTLAGHVVPFS